MQCGYKETVELFWETGLLGFVHRGQFDHTQASGFCVNLQGSRAGSVHYWLLLADQAGDVDRSKLATDGDKGISVRMLVCSLYQPRLAPGKPDGFVSQCMEII